MERKIKILSASFIVLFFAAIFIFFAFFYNAHISYIEELQLFIPDRFHLSAYFSKPASVSSIAGDFLTQFYYFPVAGAMLITLSLLLLWYVFRSCLRRLSDGDHSLVALLPVVAGLAALYDQAYPLSNVWSAIFSFAAALIIAGIDNKRFRLAASILLLPFLYVFTGSSFFLVVVFIVVSEFTGGRKHVLNAMIPLIISILVPFMFKDYYLLTPLQAYSYLSELRKGMFLADYLPLIIPAAVMILLPFLPEKAHKTSVFSISLMAIIVLLSALGVSFRASFDIEKILRLDRQAKKGNWQKVLELSERYAMRNSIASYYTNIALSKSGMLPEKLMHYYQPAATGLFIPVNADENYLTITLSNEVHWHLGDVNSSQHSALLGMIFSPRSQNSRLLKRLAEINIVNGEYEAAGKFLALLKKTRFHSSWAGEMEKLVADDQLRESAQWIKEKRSVIPKHDLLRKTEDYVPSLRMLADDNHQNSMAVNYLLCFHLLSKDLSAFAQDFKKYWSEGQRVLPEVYQEALLIRIASGAESREAYMGFVFSPEKIMQMAEYMKLYAESNGDGRNLEKKFGQTYWFYFHFARLIPERDVRRQ